MYHIDLSILYFFNQTMASPSLDVVFDVLTNVRYWFPVYVLAGVWLILRSPSRKDAVLMVLGAVALVALTDGLSHYFLKPWVGRLRPCAEVDGRAIIDWIRLPIGRKLDPSFPSSHALNNMAVAVYFVLLLGRRAWWLIAVAVLIGLGRMYEGVHYPSDVLAGFAIGAGIGMFWAFMLRRVVPSISRVRYTDSSGPA